MKLSLAATLLVAVGADGPSPLRRGDSSAAVDAVVDKLRQTDPAVLQSALRHMGYVDGRLVEDAKRRLDECQDPAQLQSVLLRMGYVDGQCVCVREEDDGAYYAVCGGGENKCVEGNFKEPNTDEVELRRYVCCSDSVYVSSEPDWVIRAAKNCENLWAYIGFEDGCKVYPYNYAKRKCRDMGARLCTMEELLEGCAEGAGNFRDNMYGYECPVDNHLVWSSTLVNSQPSSQPSLQPSSQPSAAPHYIACGGGTEKGKCDRNSKEAKQTENHPVRCCKDSRLPNWKTRCDHLWAKSGNRCEPASYTEAEEICRDMQARLCTVKELLDGCAHNVGCGFDSKLVWSKTPYNG